MSGYIGYQPFTYAERDIRQQSVTVSQTIINVNYTPGYIDVIINGSFLDPSEYIAISGTSITLNEAIADANDQVTTVAWGVFEIGSMTSNVLVSEAQPNPNSYNNGQFWLKSSTGNLFILYEDVNSKQWLRVAPDNEAGATGTFTTVDLKTVTVTDGIITEIV